MMLLVPNKKLMPLQAVCLLISQI